MQKNIEKNKISIIIPIYNGHEYIATCVNNIRKQTFKNWELILVDDGSTDDSLFICNNLKLIDKRIKVISKENGGVSSARNCGLDNATADYIMFIDVDDWIDTTLCEDLLNSIKNVDWTVSGYKQILKRKRIDVSIKSRSYNLLNNMKNCFEELYSNKLLNAPWAKLYKKKVIGEQRFDESIAFGEDLLFNLEYLSKCKSVRFIQIMEYYYNCTSENSATKVMRPGDVEQILYLYNQTRIFQDKYCRNGTTKVLIEKAFLEAGIGALQRIFYSDVCFRQKRMYAQKLLENNEYRRCCNKKYAVSKQYKLIQHMAKNKFYGLLYIFFDLKKNIYKIINS